MQNAKMTKFKVLNTQLWWAITLVICRKSVSFKKDFGQKGLKSGRG